jgi:hypothetical protein
MTSPTPSWTRREDPTAMTQRCSFSFNCLLSCRTIVWSCFSFNYRELCCSCRMLLYCGSFGGSASAEATKTVSSKKIVYSSVSWRIYEPRVSHGGGSEVHIFIGCPPLYIRRWHITDEYILNSLVSMNILGYVHQRYIRWHIHQLTDNLKYIH